MTGDCIGVMIAFDTSIGSDATFGMLIKFWDNDGVMIDLSWDLISGMYPKNDLGCGLALNAMTEAMSY